MNLKDRTVNYCSIPSRTLIIIISGSIMTQSKRYLDGLQIVLYIEKVPKLGSKRVCTFNNIINQFHTYNQWLGQQGIIPFPLTYFNYKLEYTIKIYTFPRFTSEKEIFGVCCCVRRIQSRINIIRTLTFERAGRGIFTGRFAYRIHCLLKRERDKCQETRQFFLFIISDQAL